MIIYIEVLRAAWRKLPSNTKFGRPVLICASNGSFLNTTWGTFVSQDVSERCEFSLVSCQMWKCKQVSPFGRALWWYWWHWRPQVFPLDLGFGLLMKVPCHTYSIKIGSSHQLHCPTLAGLFLPPFGSENYFNLVKVINFTLNVNRCFHSFIVDISASRCWGYGHGMSLCSLGVCACEWVFGSSC